MGDLATQLAGPVGRYAAKKTIKPLVKMAVGTLGENGAPFLELLKSTNERILEVLQHKTGSKIEEAAQLLADNARLESHSDISSEDTSDLERAADKYRGALSQQPTLEQWTVASAGYLLCREKIDLRKKVELLSQYLERWEQDLQFIINKGESVLSKAVKEKHISDRLVRLFKYIYGNAEDEAQHLAVDGPPALYLSHFVEFLRKQIQLKSIDRPRFNLLLDLADIPCTFELIDAIIAQLNHTEGGQLVRAVAEAASPPQHLEQPDARAEPPRPDSNSIIAITYNLQKQPNTGQIEMRVPPEEFSKRLGHAPAVFQLAHQSVFEALLVNFGYLNVELQRYKHALEKHGAGMAALDFIKFLQTRIGFPNGNDREQIPFTIVRTLIQMGDCVFWTYLCGYTNIEPDVCVLKKVGKKIPSDVWDNYLILDPVDMFPNLQFMDDLLLEAKTCNYGKQYQMYLIYGAYQSNPKMKDWSLLCAAMAKNRQNARKVIDFLNSSFQ